MRCHNCYRLEAHNKKLKEDLQTLLEKVSQTMSEFKPVTDAENKMHEELMNYYNRMSILKGEVRVLTARENEYENKNATTTRSRGPEKLRTQRKDNVEGRPVPCELDSSREAGETATG